MRRFILKTSSLVFFLFVVLIGLIASRYFYAQTISWQLPQEKNTLFMGASHIGRGINPEFYPSSINLASGGERYLFTFMKLLKLIEKNSQIDTLFLQFAPTDLQENTDSKYYDKSEMSHFLPLYFPFFSREEWNVYSNYRLDVLHLLIQKLPRKLPTALGDYGHYRASNNIFDRKKEPSPIRKWLKVGHSVNYQYLGKIIDVCEKHNIKLILLYMPMFRKDHYYDTEKFYSIYDKNYKGLTFLDYSDWDCPDEYRNDEHHLNKLGGKIFTKLLRADLSNKTNTPNNAK